MATINTGSASQSWSWRNLFGDTPQAQDKNISNTLGVGSGVFAAYGQMYSGFSAYYRGKALASKYAQQGEVFLAEAKRNANIIEEEGEAFAAKQSLEYIGAGIQLGGSALITLSQTKKYAKTEAEVVRIRGKNEKSIADYRSRKAKVEGKAALTSAIMKTAMTGFSTMASVG